MINGKISRDIFRIFISNTCPSTYNYREDQYYRCMKQFIIFTLLLAVITGCKKKEENLTITMTGTVYDPQIGSSVSGASVKLSVQEVSSGTWSSNYNTLGTTTSGSGGEFSFTFDHRNAVDYRVEITKSGYFGSTVSINPEDLSTDNTYNATYNFYPQAWFQVNIKNAAPYDADDRILYQTLACEECTYDLLISLEGTNVDSTITDMLYGNRWIKFEWYVTKAGATFPYRDSVFCGVGDTAYYQLNY